MRPLKGGEVFGPRPLAQGAALAGAAPMDSPLDVTMQTPGTRNRAAARDASAPPVPMEDLIGRHLDREDCAWSMGSFGALGEFLRAAGEPVQRAPGGLGIVSARGALRLEPPPGARAIAYETPSADPRLWNHAIELCLPQDRAAMNRRGVLTELGPDRDALRPADREALLFDMGLGLHQADACIRTSDAALVSALRAAIAASRGRSLLEHDHPAWGAILAASPHRVFVSRVGRLEVYVPIPAPGSVPDYHFTPGPHTHVLPQLLASGRTHAAHLPLPEGWVPCASLYPAHPSRDLMGRARPFAQPDFDAFQDLLRSHGDAALNAVKARVWQSVREGREPEAPQAAPTRAERAARRVALRQLALLAAPGGRHEAALAPALASWLRAHDRAAASGLPAGGPAHANAHP